MKTGKEIKKEVINSLVSKGYGKPGTTKIIKDESKPDAGWNVGNVYK